MILIVTSPDALIFDRPPICKLLYNSVKPLNYNKKPDVRPRQKRDASENTFPDLHPHSRAALDNKRATWLTMDLAHHIISHCAILSFPVKRARFITSCPYQEGATIVGVCSPSVTPRRAVQIHNMYRHIKRGGESPRD